MGSKWTEEEKEFLRNNVDTMSHKDIAIVLKRPRQAVKNMARKVKATSMRLVWTQEKTDFLIKHYPTMDTKELADRLNKSVYAVKQRATKYKLNKDYSNEYIFEDGMVLINLRGKFSGIYAYIEIDDYEIVKDYCWHGKTCSNGMYVFTRSTGISLHLHQMIAGKVDGKIVDHINGNPLDCRRSNLRHATRAQNAMNRVCNKKNVWQLKGVYHVGNRYCAKIGIGNKKYINSDWFDTADEAARAYDQLAKQYHGEFAKYNFPEEMR